MPQGLKRYFGTGSLHFITSSCYHRRPLLGTPRKRDVFLDMLEQVRQVFDFVVVGYVVMPEHFHLLISEPAHGSPSTVLQVLKQRVSRRLSRRKRRDPRQGRFWPETVTAAPFWQTRFYDFNLWSGNKLREKLRYMHRNPVARGLVASPEQWPWSSYLDYAGGRSGPVKLNQWPTALKPRAVPA